MGVRLEGKNNKLNAAGSSANASILTQQGAWCPPDIDCCCTLDTYVSVNNLQRIIGEKKEGELTHHDGRRSTAAADTCLLAQAQHYAALPTLSVSQICVVNEFTLVLGDCAAAAGLFCSAKAAGALPAATRSRA